MFGPKHYVPILKWKRAEQSALHALNAEDRRLMTPLVQLVMPKPKSTANPDESLISRFREKIPELPKQILKAWGQGAIFIDFSLLHTTGLKVESLKNITASGHSIGLHLIPVLNLSDSSELKKAGFAVAKKYSSGICLRLVPYDLSDIGKLDREIKTFLAEGGLREEDVDLLVDTKEIEQNGVYAKNVKASQQIPNLSNWRTFIFASGAFPADMSAYDIEDENLIPRLDWRYWRDQLNEKNVSRKPTFADYTIQYPIYKESSQFFPPTTTIKYALEADWYIMKGKKQIFEMYLAHANQLVKEEGRFCGEEFSFGDRYIAEKARHFPVYMRNKEVKGTGSTETWLTAGINHHLVLTARQVANLP